MVIRIKHLIAFQIYYLMTYNAFVSILGLPGLLKHVLDVNLILILGFSLSRIPGFFKNKNYNKLFIYIIFYIAFTLLVAFAKSVPVGQVLWAVRNNFFFLFYFMICIDVLHKEDCDKIMQNIFKLQFFNVICAAFEFVFMGARNDFLGGMFGTAQGCNVYLHIYMLVITVYVIIRYLSKLEKLSSLLWIILSNVAIAAASELKIYFIELAVIFIMAVVLNNKKSFKNIYIILFAGLGLFIGFNILAAVNSDSVSFFTDMEQFLYYNTRTEYSDGARVSRFTFFQQINDWFFHDNTALKIFGYGFGACESSKTFAWCNSSFADKYEDTQYRNLSTSMIYLEQGIVGLILVAIIFIAIILIATKFKKSGKFNDYSVQFTQIFAFLILINLAYNAGIRIEIAYLTFFVLATVFVRKKDFDNTYAVKSNIREQKQIYKSKYIKGA